MSASATAHIVSSPGESTTDKDIAVPSDPILLEAYGYRTRRRLCQLALQLTHDPPNRRARVLTEEEYRELRSILRTLSSITSISPETAKILKLKDMLKILNGTASNTKWVFPQPFPSIATTALEQYERVNWGAVEEISVINQDATDDSHAGRRFHPLMNDRSVTRSRQPPPNHPIFGTAGIMRGILVDTSGGKVKRSIEPSQIRNSKIVGHNGLTVGQWWPFQICALRDGAHGSMMSGIAGGENEGAFSIVVSGGKYDDFDEDHGDVLLYTGSQAYHAPDRTSTDFSHGTKALQRSYQLGRPLRVLRSYKAKNVYAPSHGIRYDGLYRITEEKVRRNREGRSYLRFRLERMSGQGGIERERPSREEAGLMERASGGY